MNLTSKEKASYGLGAVGKDMVYMLSSGIAAFIASICLQITNISKDTSDVVAEAASGSSVAILRMTMSILPIAGLLIACYVFYKKYILTDEKLAEITRELGQILCTDKN